MNIHSVITVVAIAVIVSPFAYSGLSIFGAQQLEHRWHSPGQFSFFTMSNHGEIEFCNTLPFWTSFQSFEVKTFYDAKHVGSFAVNSATINPSSSQVQKGVFSSDQISAAQHMFMTLDYEFDGGDIRLDPNKLVVVTETSMPILGIIPYSSTSQISGFEFDKMMNVEDLSCD